MNFLELFIICLATLLFFSPVANANTSDVTQDGYDAQSIVNKISAEKYEGLCGYHQVYFSEKSGKNGSHEKLSYCENLDIELNKEWTISCGKEKITELRPSCNINSQDHSIAIPPDAVPEPATVFVLGFVSLFLFSIGKIRHA